MESADESSDPYPSRSIPDEQPVCFEVAVGMTAGLLPSNKFDPPAAVFAC
jgi:hypothetical protein